MIDILPILKIAPIAAIAMMAPGPDFFLTTSISLARGRMAGIMAACGIAAGVVIWSSLGMFGVSTILDKIHWLIFAIRIAGGIYLIYLGMQLWRVSFTQKAPTADAPTVKQRHPFAIGFLTNLTNPKAIAFFTSIFALTLTPDTSIATQSAIVAMVSIMPIFWFGFVALVLSMPVMRESYMRASKWIDRIAGTFLAFFGLRLLWSGRNN